MITTKILFEKFKIDVALTPAVTRRKQEILRLLKRDTAHYKAAYGKDYLSVLNATALTIAKLSKKESYSSDQEIQEEIDLNRTT